MCYINFLRSRYLLWCEIWRGQRKDNSKCFYCFREWLTVMSVISFLSLTLIFRPLELEVKMHIFHWKVKYCRGTLQTLKLHQLFAWIVPIKIIRESSVMTMTVVMGVTLGSTNQKAGYRSRGTNGPISVQQKVMWPVNHHKWFNGQFHDANELSITH